MLLIFRPQRNKFYGQGIDGLLKVDLPTAANVECDVPAMNDGGNEIPPTQIGIGGLDGLRSRLALYGTLGFIALGGLTSCGTESSSSAGGDSTQRNPATVVTRIQINSIPAEGVSWNITCNPDPVTKKSATGKVGLGGVATCGNGFTSLAADGKNQAGEIVKVTVSMCGDNTGEVGPSNKFTCGTSL
jgi:hypothetical protein